MRFSSFCLACNLGYLPTLVLFAYFRCSELKDSIVISLDLLDLSSFIYEIVELSKLSTLNNLSLQELID